jgi:cytoskeletal protein CcmA (bactofilin family)
MWNRKKEEDTPTRSIPQTTPAVPASAREPQASMPMRSYESSMPSGMAATIGKAVRIKGQISSREDLVIDGEIEGTVEAQEHRVTIGPNGKVQAGINAREIVVLGAIHGNVEASEKIDIRKDARLVGDIKTSRIVIEDGAYFKGSIDIQKSEPKPQRVAQQREPAPSAASAPVQTPAPAAAGTSEGRK